MKPAPIVSDPRQQYTRRIARWSHAIARGERKHFLVSNLRLAVAVGGAVMAWQAFHRETISAAWMAAPIVGILALVVAHARVIGQNERAARARRLYQRGVDRLEGRWAHGAGRRTLPPRAFLRPGSDLFGPASLFQLLHTVRTEAGEDTLGAGSSDAAAGQRHPRAAGGRRRAQSHESISEKTLRFSPLRHASARPLCLRAGPRRDRRA